jgi:transcriptional regulator with XRE-family HTH domain
MENTKKSALDTLLDEITPLEQAKTDAKMMLAARIADALKEKKWKNKDLLAAVGKDNPSVITKWLSGTHNFTVDTLVELENALDISLLNLEGIKEEPLARFHFAVKSEAPFSLGLDIFNQIIMGSEENADPHLYKGFNTHFNACVAQS